jgi:hypothetical protein
MLAGNTQLIGNCVENSCKLHTTGLHLVSETDMCSRFSGRKQTNKQNKNTQLFNFFLNGLPDFSVIVYEAMIYYWTLHTLQHTALCFGNN